ncbi:hypothetical protein L596_006633 [Steinernema carpocapsae]|uniref:Protein zer-1 homolog-like C-terminal domain-containing protein n=1 Tax=Steinernema carpocapsae TaxID=34508 RepID=A0A4V6I8U6_STECR|nr:hypothetical protein L596_006633 [Steinernema carpocapsae]
MGTPVPSLTTICHIYIGRMIKEGTNIYPDDCQPMPSTVADGLFQSLHDHDHLTCSTFRLMSNTKATLTRADVSRRSFDECAVVALSGQRLKYLNFCKAFKVDHAKVPFDMSSFCKNPSRDATQTLKYLNLCMNQAILNLGCLTLFPHLTYLSVSSCPTFTDDHFERVCYSLSCLKHLDVSETKVTTISALPKLAKNLRHFFMHRLNLKMSAEEYCLTLVQMRKLETLDISSRRQEAQVTDYTSQQREYARVLIDFCILQRKTVFPRLQLLDVSGNSFTDDLGTEIAYKVIMKFVKKHPSLRFLNVLDTALSRQVFMLTFHRKNRLCVANGGTRTQSIQSLMMYARSDREVFVAHALQSIFYLLQANYDNFTERELRDTICGIEVAMRFNRRNVQIQMAGSACFYHICRLNRIKQLEPVVISLILKRCLDASINFKTYVQLQKNIWLTVCNDHLLQSQTCTHTMYKTCYVALESMIATRDPSIARIDPGRKDPERKDP